ncbi:MAG TPA: hypothetical protein VGP72_12495 [Planctomycetota bacterium]|jgi:hypothetical protein
MKTRVLPFVLLCTILATLALAGQVAPQPIVGDDDNIAKKLFESLRKNMVRDPKSGGVGNVMASQAALCNVCGQPLFRHDGVYECLPPDRRIAQIVRVPTPVKCPVCSSAFTGTVPCNINERGGRDRDFCVHSVGKVTVHSVVWFCAECGYCAMIPPDQKAEGFALGLDGKPLDESVKQFVREKLSDKTRKQMLKAVGLKEDATVVPELLQFNRYIVQNEIPDWLKYNNAIEICEFQKAPHLVLAKLYYEGAHACRRQIAEEVAVPALDSELQQYLGKAINRMNWRVQARCRDIRKQHGDPSIDPTRAESDPCNLVEAAAALLREAREDAAKRRAEGTSGGAYYETADLLVLNLIYGAALDRVGDVDAAEKALRDALSLVPEHINLPADAKDLTERVEKQLKLLRGICDVRLNCLKSEREYLFKAAMRQMAAIKSQQVKFQSAEFNPKGQPPHLWEPAATSYLLGELLRRCGVHESAGAWFAAAERILLKKSDLLEAAEKAQPPAPPVVPLPGQAPPQNPFEQERIRLAILRQWTLAQHALFKPAGAPDENTAAVIAQVLKTAGLEVVAPASVPAVPTSNTNTAATTKTDVKPSPDAPKATPAAGAMTREKLYKMYYAALMTYRKEKKENPKNLRALVQAGYLKADDSGLDEVGKLHCPETKETLIYMRTWDPGEKAMEILFPAQRKPGGLILYADGEIRAWKQ